MQLLILERYYSCASYGSTATKAEYCYNDINAKYVVNQYFKSLHDCAARMKWAWGMMQSYVKR